jgi:hypothetical protein
MKNLAGVPEADDDIRLELEKAIIPAVSVSLTRSEVPYTLIGKLGEFEFRRAWYYWIATGNVPLEVAKELYADPIGKKDIRVSGHCGCPPPEDPWLKYVTEDGYELIRESEREQWYAVFKDKADSYLQEKKLRFSSDRAAEGKASVDCYHIDTMEGLRLFADTLRKYRLV